MPSQQVRETIRKARSLAIQHSEAQARKYELTACAGRCGNFFKSADLNRKNRCPSCARDIGRKKIDLF